MAINTHTKNRGMFFCLLARGDGVKEIKKISKVLQKKKMMKLIKFVLEHWGKFLEVSFEQ